MKFLGVLFLMMASLGSEALAAKYSMAQISLGYGKLDIGSGGGYIYASTDDATGKLKSISIDVTAGMLGFTQNINQSQDIKALIEGKSLSFYMEGSSKAVMIIRPQSGFNAYGGKISISVLKSSGYTSSNLEVAKGTTSKKYKFWYGDSSVSRFDINMRGYSIAEMVVGWYSIVTN
jgi:hypothetical protein